MSLSIGTSTATSDICQTSRNSTKNGHFATSPAFPADEKKFKRARGLGFTLLHELRLQEISIRLMDIL